MVLIFRGIYPGFQNGKSWIEPENYVETHFGHTFQCISLAEALLGIYFYLTFSPYIILYGHLFSKRNFHYYLRHVLPICTHWHQGALKK